MQLRSQHSSEDAGLAAEALLSALRRCSDFVVVASDAWAEDVRQLAAKHGVGPLIPDLTGRPPQRRLSARGAAAVNSLRAASTVAKVTKAFEELATGWAVLKGPVIAGLGYGDHTLRAFGDLDLLVDPTDFGAAVRLLCNAGFELLDKNWELQLRARRAEAAFRSPDGFAVDLHWHPINNRPQRVTTMMPIAEMLGRRRMVPFSTLAIPALDPVDNLLVVAVHAAVSGGHRLLWMKDVERLSAEDEVDWMVLVDRCRRYRVSLPVALVLARSQRLLGTSLPEFVLPGLLRGRPWMSALVALEGRVQDVAVVTGSRTMRTLFVSARESSLGTLASLSSEVAKRGKYALARVPLHGGEVGEAGSDLRTAGSPSSMDRYLRAVAQGELK